MAFVVSQAADHHGQACGVTPLSSHKAMNCGGTSISRTLDVETAGTFDTLEALDSLDMTELRFAQRTKCAPLASANRIAHRVRLGLRSPHFLFMQIMVLARFVAFLSHLL
jgi:hypothetical protein